MQEEHQKELVKMEERLQAFYQAQWDKVQQSYQEEADKCRCLMEQQVWRPFLEVSLFRASEEVT